MSPPPPPPPVNAPQLQHQKSFLPPPPSQPPPPPPSLPPSIPPPPTPKTDAPPLDQQQSLKQTNSVRNNKFTAHGTTKNQISETIEKFDQLLKANANERSNQITKPMPPPPTSITALLADQSKQQPAKTVINVSN